MKKVQQKFHGIILNKMNFNNTPIDWGQVHDVIEKASRIMLTTHENPDGDGLGSQSGLYYHLNEINKEVRIINYSPLPVEYEYLNVDNIFESYHLLHIHHHPDLGWDPEPPQLLKYQQTSLLCKDHYMLGMVVKRQ